MKIAVVGLGYVGLSNAVLLARKHCVVALDVSHERVTLLNAGICPVRDPLLEQYLREGHALYDNLHPSRIVVGEQSQQASEDAFSSSPVTHDLAAFKSGTDLIVANRMSTDPADVADKVFGHDLFGAD